MADLPDKPITLEEKYLASIAGQSVELPEPMSRIDRYLAYIAENGGIGGVATFNGRAGYVIPQARDYDEFFAYALYNYDGVNIKDKFAGEMDFTDPSTWIRQRLAVHDVSGLHPKDFFEFTTTDSKLVKAQIAGINHDLRYCDTELTGWHIDFISKDCFPEYHQWNNVNYNNGLSGDTSPWMASDLKAWLNAEKADVPSEIKADPETVSVDYTTTGLLARLPEILRSNIGTKRKLVGVRYTAGSLLTDDTSWKWVGLGKLWVPDEMEVYGCCVWGTKGWSQGNSHQYDIFRDGKMRIKGFGDGGSRCTWWLLTPCSGNSTAAASISGDGHADNNRSLNSSIAEPVCFRIYES